MSEKEFKGLPTIDEYYKNRGYSANIKANELDHIMEELLIKTSLTKEQSKSIIELFFEEIRAAVLNQEKVDIRGFGSFFISSPKTSGNSKKKFIAFKTKKSLINRINNGRR